MEYVTVTVNKKFLLISALLVGFVGFTVVSYRVGYSRGATAAMAYIMELMQGDNKSLDNNI
jgi:hypothetical protein